MDVHYGTAKAVPFPIVAPDLLNALKPGPVKALDTRFVKLPYCRETFSRPRFTALRKSV